MEGSSQDLRNIFKPQTHNMVNIFAWSLIVGMKISRTLAIHRCSCCLNHHTRPQVFFIWTSQRKEKKCLIFFQITTIFGYQLIQCQRFS